MYESLMKTGNHRVDYFHEEIRGTPQSYAFYIMGNLPGNAPYSKTAKHHILNGLMVLETSLGLSDLVGIYVDIASSEPQAASAFHQLAEDLKNDYFKRVVVCSMQDLTEQAGKNNALNSLRQISRDFELIVLKEYEVCNGIPGLPNMVAA
jgi:hypothetical protein